MASRTRSRRGKPHSLRQSPAASSQNLSVEDNSSSQASWSSDEDHTHMDEDHTRHSPSLSWTSGDIDTEGPGGTEFQNETSAADYGNETGEDNFENGNETGEQDVTGDTGEILNDRGKFTEPTLLEAQFEMLTEPVEEPPSETAEHVDAASNLPSPTPPPHTTTPTPPPMTTPTSPAHVSPHVSPPPSPILQTSPKLSRNSPSPVPVSGTSPSPISILCTSPSPIPSSRNSPSPIPTPPPELAGSNGRREGEETTNNPFSPELDEVMVTEYTPKASVNPFEEEVPAGMENVKNSDSEPESDPESTLKPVSTNPFIQLSEVPSTTDNLNPFGESPTNPFDLPPPPPMLSSNPFDNDVITNDNDVIVDEAGSAAGGDVVQHAAEGEGKGEGEGEGSIGWSETSSTAEGTLPSLEETHCISLSVFQQGKDSPSNLSAQYDKLSDLSSLLDKGSDRSSQLDRVSEEGEEWSRPESREKSDGETVSSFPSSVDLSLAVEAEPMDNMLHPQENYYENEVSVV